MIDLNVLTAERVYDLVSHAALDANVATIRCLINPTKRHPLAVLSLFNVDGSVYSQLVFEVDYYTALYDLLAEYDLYNKKHLLGFLNRLSTFADVSFQPKSYQVAQAA
jgi:hypothetical protein